MIRKQGIIACISFTFVLLFYCLLSEVNLTSTITSQKVYQLLIMNIVIAGTMHFTQKLLSKGVFFFVIGAIFNILLVVFFMGGVLFHMFTFTMQNILIVTGMLVLVFFIVFGSQYTKNKVDATSINNKIKVQRGERNE